MGSVRIRCTEATRIKVAPNTTADLDAHHEYYLDDDVAEKLVADGRAVELDARTGQQVEQRRAASKPAVEQAADDGAEAPAKPAAKRATKATRPPENKTATSGGVSAKE